MQNFNLEPLEPGRVWYIAYGSNMSTAAFQVLRSCVPKRALVVRVPGYCLSFNVKGVAYKEPCWASISEIKEDASEEEKKRLWEESCPGLEYEGKLPPTLVAVAYDLSEEDFTKKVVWTEAGFSYQDLSCAYATVNVDCQVLGGNELHPSTQVFPENSVWNLGSDKPNEDVITQFEELIAQADKDGCAEVKATATAILGMLKAGQIQGSAKPTPQPAPSGATVRCTKEGQETFLSKGFTHIQGKTLIAVSSATGRNLWPTERYLARVRNGAIENGLPEHYVNHLKSLEFFQIRSWKKYLMSGALLKQVEPVWIKLAATISQCAKEGKQVPHEFARDMDTLQKNVNAKELVLLKYIGSGWRTDE